MGVLVGGLIAAELVVPLQPGFGGHQLVLAGGVVVMPLGVGGDTHLNYQPKTAIVYIGLNDTVTFVNVDSAKHTVTATDGSFDSGDVLGGGNWTHKFTAVGNYTYYCVYHVWMKANVVVKELAGSGLVVVTIPAGTGFNTNLNFEPSSLHLVAGRNNTVVFVNQDSGKHTVTASDGSFDSGDLQPGQTWQHTFLAGPYSYRCIYHAYMAGTIDVSQG
ncbi:MAG: cupredoxin domain-containing protein [Thaumarchaeota archaeon]|nr:cupredoxin domain-containing protein [Nitrososphaerota archaeon]